MTTVVIDVQTLDESHADFVRSWETQNFDPTPRISFVSYELMHKILAPNRMTIIQAMTGAGRLSIREVARRVNRDFKGVHTDVTALINNGIVEKSEDGKVVFPYDDIHFDFRISSAA
jgi:predicted transcriptional regulator